MLAGVLTAGCDGYFVVIAVAPSSQVIVVDPTQKGGSIGGPKKETPPEGTESEESPPLPADIDAVARSHRRP